MEERILFVDDDFNVLEAYQRKLQHALHVHIAQGPHAGLKEVQAKGPFAVVVTDMNMPLMNGVEFLKKVRELSPDTVRMMLTGNANINVAMDAVNDGNVFRFLTKPCPSKLMGESLLAAIKQYRLITAEKEILEGTLKGTAELLTEVLSWTNPETFGRALQLRNTARMIAARLHAENPWEIELAATLCQIGVLAIPSEIPSRFASGDPLTQEERQTLESVPSIGHELLTRIPRLENVARIVLYQNKNLNGDGFPQDQVKDKEIPLGSRILKVAGDYHRLRAAGQSPQETLKTMQSQDGLYDAGVLSVLVGEYTSMAMQAETRKVVAIPFRDLRVGITLASPILTTEGRTLVSAGKVITDALLVRLREYAATSGIKEPIEVLIHKESS